MPTVIKQTVPLDAEPQDRGAMMLNLGEFVANLQQSGMSPVLSVDMTSDGDTFVITLDDDAEDAVDDDGDTDAA